MPIYEYKCEACGSKNEFRMKMSDNAPESCPDCSEGPLKKQVSMTSFQLKGDGWYVTDFRGDKKNESSNPSDSSSEKTNSSEKTASGSSDSAKPATKSPSDKKPKKKEPKPSTASK
jgi:putative FmdB family regulatory protein